MSFGPRIYLLLTALTAFGAMVCLKASIVETVEGLVSDTDIVELGDRYQGDIVAAQFRIRNPGNTKTEVVGVERQCTCVATSVPTRVMEAGSEQVLALEWKVGASRGFVAIPIVVWYKVDGQNLEQPLRLCLRASVIPDFNYVPVCLRFSPTKSPQTRSVTLSPGRLSDVVVVSATCTHRAFQASVSSDQGRATVRVTFDPALWLPDENARTLLEVRTTSPHEKIARIPIEVDSAF